jgi:cupin 2 domain-containing protein
LGIENLFHPLPDAKAGEIIETLLENDHFRIERIVSEGQATPPGEWFNQETDEWVILLQGSAGLMFEGGLEIAVMRPGDYVLISAHRKHRVEWTDNTQKTVWLAVHL